MKFETLLNKEIEEDIEALGGVDFGSDEYKSGVDSVTKLIDRAIELKKIDVELAEKVESRNIDNELKKKQMSESKADRIVGHIITAAGIIIPVIVTIWGTKASFKFEQEGTVTTIMGRGFINKLLPKK